MRLAAPSSALAPFMTDEIILKPATKAAELVQPVFVKACVKVAAPPDNSYTPGQPSRRQYSVSLLRSSLPAGVKIEQGAWIEPGDNWPKLHVQSVTRNGDVVHLTCTAKEAS